MPNLAPSAMLEPLANPWLALQCQMIPSVRKGALYLSPNKDTSQHATACWPEGTQGTCGLAAAATLAGSKRRPVVSNPKASAGLERQDVNIACPVLIDGLQAGVVAVEVADPNEQQQRAVMQILQWGVSWLEFLVRREGATSANALMTAFRIIATGLERDRFEAAATATVTELASSLSCERVCIGFERGGTLSLCAMSNSAKTSAKSNLVRDIEAAMHEAIDQQMTVVLPDTGATNAVLITRAHEKLVTEHRAGAACTVPLGNDGQIYGALTFERAAEQTFERPTIELCEVVASLLGPILELKRKGGEPLHRRAMAHLRSFTKKLLGPKHTLLKLITCTSLFAGIVLAFVDATYRVTARVTLEGTVQHTVTAPIDGYIESAVARAGDTVRQGELLGALDDDELKLERARWQTQLDQFEKEYRQALGAHDRAQTVILGAQIEQAKAQLGLLEEQLARTRLLSPFDGIVVVGDLAQQLGSPVERGQILFEIAPLDSYRGAIEVEERDVAAITPGQTGHLALTGVPGETFAFTVDNVAPISTAEEGKNFFRVEGAITGDLQRLRPGMAGIAKVEAGRRKLWWILSHDIVHWTRLWLWSVSP